ncbi:hypothetical protein B0O99DRAFT_685107 [Bisporella sp. PMI_857]|nr:hypothetical protein B0O99DRAFT_685107 [Bisporella sp. PMI_857]
MFMPSANNLGPSLLAINVAFPVLSIITVSLRIYTSAFLSREIKVDDYLIISATIISIASAGTLVPSITAGLGQHIAFFKANEIIHVLKIYFAAHTISITALFLAKISIAVLFFRLPRSANSSAIICTTIGLSTVNWIFGNVIAFAQCSPLSVQWDVRQNPNKNCWSPFTVFICNVCENVIGSLTSFLLLLLAITLVHACSISPLRKKGSEVEAGSPLEPQIASHSKRTHSAVLILLLVGLFTASISILPAITLSPTRSQDRTFLPAFPTLWSIMHLHLLLITNNLFALSPALHRSNLVSSSTVSLPSTNTITKPDHKSPRAPPMKLKLPSMFSNNYTGKLQRLLPSRPKLTHPHKPCVHARNISRPTLIISPPLFLGQEAPFSSQKQPVSPSASLTSHPTRPPRSPGAPVWRPISPRKSTQDFLLDLFPHPGQERHPTPGLRGGLSGGLGGGMVRFARGRESDGSRDDDDDDDDDEEDVWA